MLLHHEIKVNFKDGRPSERHVATLLEFGDVRVGSTDPFNNPHSAMARTVGLPAAIGAHVCIFFFRTSYDRYTVPGIWLLKDFYWIAAASPWEVAYKRHSSSRIS